MQWTVRLEARVDRGEVEATELVTPSRPAVAGTLADLGLALAEAKAVLAKLQRIMVQSQAAEYVAYHRVCPHGVTAVGITRLNQRRGSAKRRFHIS